MIKEEEINKIQMILKSTPSIHQNEFDFRQNSLNSLNFLQQTMKLQYLPIFDLETLKQDLLMNKKKQFYFFLTILQKWNTKISQGTITYYERTNFELNNFIYFYLKNILLHSEPAKTINLLKLYEWYTNTIESKPIFNQLIRKIQNKMHRNISKQYIREIQDIRKSFTSSLPLKINSFNRKLLYPKPIICKENLKENYPQNCENRLTDKLFLSGQKKLQQIRQQKEIKGMISNYKINKSRWKQSKINSNFFLERILTQKPCDSNEEQFSNHTIKQIEVTRISSKQLNGLRTEKSEKILSKKSKKLSKILKTSARKESYLIPQNTIIQGITLIKNPFDQHQDKSHLKIQ